MAGAAVIVSLQQLKGLLGIQHFTPKMDIVYVLRSVLERKSEVSLVGQKIRLGFYIDFIDSAQQILFLHGKRL